MSDVDEALGGQIEPDTDALGPTEGVWDVLEPIRKQKRLTSGRVHMAFVYAEREITRLRAALASQPAAMEEWGEPFGITQKAINRMADELRKMYSEEHYKISDGGFYGDASWLLVLAAKALASASPDPQEPKK